MKKKKIFFFASLKSLKKGVRSGVGFGVGFGLGFGLYPLVRGRASQIRTNMSRIPNTAPRIVKKDV
jgi:hypothetical protein